MIEANGTCILESHYEYDDPLAERQNVNSQIPNAELKTAALQVLGVWAHGTTTQGTGCSRIVSSMLPKPDDITIVNSWTNGQKAAVHLVKDRTGRELIVKAYRPGFTATMFREYAVTSYVARRLSVVPKVLGFRPWRKELYLSYIPGQRVLEWVLQRFGGTVTLSEFQSFHGLNPPHHVDPRVADAFARFRQSTSEEAHRLKEAIRTSYSYLHRIGILHGSPCPRNAIYDQDHVFIIDFDHARPSFNPAKIDYKSLRYWYGCLSAIT